MVIQYTTHQVEPGITVAEFTGQLTLGNRLLEVEHDIKEKILKDCTQLVLDLTKLSYIDSAGIGMLALCVGTLQRAGGQVSLAVVDGKVKNMIELVRLNQVVNLYPDAAAACAALADPASTPPA